MCTGEECRVRDVEPSGGEGRTIEECTVEECGGEGCRDDVGLYR